MDLSVDRPTRPRLRGRLHVLGVAGILVVAPWLTAVASTTGRRWSVAVFVVSVAVMFATSACYHVVTWPPRWLPVLRRVDHSAIFVGIAGTYTPFLVTALAGTGRTRMLVGVWVGALAGAVVNNVAHHAPSWVRTIPYLVLGWVAVVLVPSLWRLSPAVLWLVVAGGLAYNAGAVVYARRRPDPWPTTFGYHELFHALTLVAVALHVVAVGLAIST